MSSEAQASSSSSPVTPPAPGGAVINLLAWVEVNKKRLAYGGLAALAVILGVAIYVQQQSGREAAASGALSDIRMPSNPGMVPDPGTADKLLAVANRYQGTKAAAQALARSASTLYLEGDFAKAQERFNALLQQYPDCPWVADAHLGVAASLEAQGKTEDAIKKYEDIRKRFANSPIADDVKLSLARLYEKSNGPEAFRLYEELAKGNPNTPTTLEANFRQEELLKSNPDLAKLREPVVAPMPQPPVQVTTVTNRPAQTTNRTVTLTNLLHRTNAPGPNLPARTNLNPAPAPAPGK